MRCSRVSPWLWCYCVPVLIGRSILPEDPAEYSEIKEPPPPPGRRAVSAGREVPGGRACRDHWSGGAGWLSRTRVVELVETTGAGAQKIFEISLVDKGILGGFCPESVGAGS